MSLTWTEETGSASCILKSHSSLRSCLDVPAWSRVMVWDSYSFPGIAYCTDSPGDKTADLTLDASSWLVAGENR